ARPMQWVVSSSRGIVIGLVAVGSLLPATLRAQAAPLVVEFQGGAAVPVGDLADGTGPGEGVTAGASFGVHFAASGQGRRTLYVGFSQHRFGCTEAGCPPAGRYVATTLDFGFRLNLLTRGAVIPWVRVGGLTMRVETPTLPSGPAGVSDRGYGGEVGLGVYVGAWSSVALNPGVRISAVGTRLPGGQELDMRFVVADLGLSLAF
ncbi:MAG TPA: hypothetical protein VE173_06560, partial [Longimicrobiales bacterium]|nr:hypothetical protein [Longimicrobiales bacterium]